MIDDFLLHLFYEGNCLEAYKLFGAHLIKKNNKTGVLFTTYAPNAKAISVIGDFNGWNNQTHPMAKINESVWSVFIEECKEGSLYKYAITTSNDQVKIKSDPYAIYSELRPNTASIVCEHKAYDFSDEAWMESRDKCFTKPLNIYEIHFGSWDMVENFTEDEDGVYYSYRELASKLIPYVKKMGYSHIEILPLLEHPFDGSWGYQPTGYFSVTSRYGSIDDLRYFINECHKENIGVIMDFVPVHFVKDEHGLYQYDGGSVYEYPDPNRRYTEWDSAYFDLGRNEVQSFMMSSVYYWLNEFHIDGIRFDAVSHLIYNFGKKDCGLNDGAIYFMQKMNRMINERCNNVMLIAEDSSDYPQVTRSWTVGGLGFDYKWDLGWMNDTMKYLSLDPVYRQNNHHLITFSMAYFYGENYILPLSHDEVVHSKGTIIDKIYGTHEQKFAQLRTLYMYMMTHPGKKLNFMGNELAEYKEWDEKHALGWNILQYPIHDAFHKYTRDLNTLMVETPALYQYDYYPEGFRWLVVDDNQQSVFAYQRQCNDGKYYVIVLNFTENCHEGYQIPVYRNGKYTRVISSDEDKYSGSNYKLQNQIETTKHMHYKDQDVIEVNLGSYASVVFQLEIEG